MRSWRVSFIVCAGRISSCCASTTTTESAMDSTRAAAGPIRGTSRTKWATENTQRVPGSGNDLFGEMKVNKQLATSTTAVLYTTAVGCADLRSEQRETVCPNAPHLTHTQTDLPLPLVARSFLSSLSFSLDLRNCRS